MNSKDQNPQSTNVKYSNPMYAQLVIGPPGSGKTTYCHQAAEFYKKIGRKVGIINLDPANENMKYKADLDVMDLITVADVMEIEHIGPNGALMYCMEFLEAHYEEWLLTEVRKICTKYNFFIIDCPGQVELYTHHMSTSRIFQNFLNFGFNMVAVNLIDAHYCSEPTKFVSTLLLALNMMLHMALPHVNVLSKADMLKMYEHKLQFNIDFYTDVLDLSYLVEALDSTPTFQRYKKLNNVICNMIQDYSLVSFQLLNSYDTYSLLSLRNITDKAHGYTNNATEEQFINALLTSEHIDNDEVLKNN